MRQREQGVAGRPRKGLKQEFGESPGSLPALGSSVVWGMVSSGSCKRKCWGCLARWDLSRPLPSQMGRNRELQRGMKPPA